MLIEFRFKNFASFRDEQVLSMVASSDRTLAEANTIPIPSLGKRGLIRSAMVYGANASGKSNLVAALAFVKGFVEGSANQNPDKEIPLTPFLLDDTSVVSRSEFEITFVHNTVRYQYGLSLDRNQVYEEWLIAYPKGLPQKWFERSPIPNSNESEWYFGPYLKGEKARLASLTRPNVLFLSIAAKFNHKQLSEVYRWFSYQLRMISADVSTSMSPYVTATLVKTNDAFHTRLKALVQFADLGIEDFSIRERDLPEDMPEKVRDMITKGNMDLIIRTGSGISWGGRFDVQLLHRTGDDKESGISLSLEDESRGTQRLFCIGGPWLHTLQEGFTLVVDELASSLHPILVRALVSMFHDPHLNSRYAQLVFNTHDTTLLDPSLFRRDQIWFVEKDNSGASQLYPLLDYRPRKDESLEKWYLQGRYGAIPIIGDLDLLGEDTSDGKG